MRVYICPMCLNTLTKLSDTRKGLCEDCRHRYNLRDCGQAERDSSPGCIEVRA